MYLFIPSWSIAIFFLSQMPWSTYVYHLQGDDHFYSPLLGIGKTHDSFWSGWLLVLFHRPRSHDLWWHKLYIQSRADKGNSPLSPFRWSTPCKDYICVSGTSPEKPVNDSINLYCRPFFHNLPSSFFLLNQ